MRRLALMGAVAGIWLLAVPAARAQQPIEPLGTQFRLSTTGPDGDVATRADRGALAADTERSRYLLVYDAIHPDFPADRGVYARLLDADGRPLAAPLRIGAAEPATSSDANETPSPAVAYNPSSDVYVIAFSGVPAGSVAGHHEIRSAIVSADGGLIAGPRTISESGTGNDDATRDAIRPTVISKTSAGQALVAWETDGLSAAADNEYEIVARVIGTDGAPDSPQWRVSFTGDDGDGSDDAFNVQGTLLNDAFLLTWGADPADNSDLYAVKVDLDNPVPSGAPVNLSMADPNPSLEAFGGASAVDSRGRIVVAWMQELTASGTLGDSEIHVVGLNGSLARVFEPRVVSSVGAAGSASFNADMPRIAYNPALDRFLVTWRADGAAPGLADNEWEIFGQVITPDGVEVGADRRVSTVAGDGQGGFDAVDGADNVYFATRYGLASSTTRKDWLVVYAADGAATGMLDEEYDIFGRFVGENPDGDGDGSPVPADCNDTNAAVRPGATDVPDNGVDEDCSGADAVNLDRDGDGSPRPGDCDDASALIAPGRTDVAGNGVDEDCSGADALLELDGTVAFSFSLFANFTKIGTLKAKRLVEGDRVTVSCAGRRCPFKKRRVFTAKRSSVNLKKLFPRARVKPGVTIRVAITRAGAIGHLRVFKIRKGKLPTRRSACLAPGSTSKRVSCP